MGSDIEWMKLAIAQARLSGDDVPVGCVLVLDGRVIGQGYNQREAKADPTGHAEITALREAAKHLSTWRLNGTTLYSSLEPCPMCAEAIIQSRVARVVFGAYDQISGAAGSAFNLFVEGRVYPIPEVVGGIHEEECRRLLSDFFKQKGGR